MALPTIASLFEARAAAPFILSEAGRIFLSVGRNRHVFESNAR